MGTTQVQDTRRASSMVRGTGCRETNLRVRRREKNVLDIPAATRASDKRGCQDHFFASAGSGCSLMRYLLDTNSVSDLVRSPQGKLAQHIRKEVKRKSAPALSSLRNCVMGRS